MAVESMSLPIINLSPSANQEETSKQMLEAALSYGFLYIDTRDSDFTPEVIEREFELVSLAWEPPEASHEADHPEIPIVQGLLLIPRA